MPTLTLSGLHFGYGPKPLFTIKDFALKEKDSLLIRGASGSGKTSLLFILAGLLAPTSGNVVVQGQNLTSLTPRQRDAFRGQIMGFVFQQPHLMPALTVLQNLLVVPYLGGIKPDEPHAKELLERLHIAELTHRKPQELSQGQRQRVGIARALVHKPKLLLADEPTSALDDQACQAVMDLLMDTAKAQGTQVVAASHDARIAQHFTQTLKL